MLSTAGLLPRSAQATPVQCPQAIDPAAEEILFTFNTLIYAASAVATPAQASQLQPFLLTYQPNARLDALYPVRLAVAQAVRQWPTALQQRSLNFLLQHPAAVTNYNALILQLVGAAPSFAPLHLAVPGGAAEQHIFAHRVLLASLLRDIYRQGQVQQLWQHQQQSWQASHLCRDHLVQLRQGIATYLRTPLPPLGADSQVLSNPLMPLGSGVTCVFSDGHFIMLVGPTLSRQEGDMLVTHELLHPALAQLLAQTPQLRLALQRSACVYTQAVQHNPQSLLTRYVYTSWESYLSEVLVRSISHKLSGVPEYAAAAFEVAPVVAQHLRAYETHGGSFIAATVRLTEALSRSMCGGIGATA